MTGEGQVLETLPDIALILVGGCALGLGWLKFEGLERASAGVVADELSPRLVSVIIPARAEAAFIGRTLEQLSRATYPRLEVFVVADSSRDATGSIARSIATSWDRIQVLEIDRLVPEWLGKPHALQHGFDHSRGEWLCFIDADVHLEPICIEKAVRLAEARGLDHLSVFPNMVVYGMLETAFVMAFAFYFSAYVRGLEKNAFAGLDFSIPKVLMATTGVVAMSILPFAGILVADGYRCVGAARSIAVIAVGHAVIARYMRVGTLHFLLHPFAAALMVWSIWR